MKIMTKKSDKKNENNTLTLWEISMSSGNHSSAQLLAESIKWCSNNWM